MINRQRAPLFDDFDALCRIMLFVTIFSTVYSCSSLSCDDVLQLPLDGHCGSSSLHIQGSMRWCKTMSNERFISIHVQSSSVVVSRKEFCSGLNLTVDAGVHKLSISLHEDPPPDTNAYDGCPCSLPIYFVADPLLKGPDVFSELLLPSGLPVVHRLLSQMRNTSGHGVDLVLGLHAGIEDSRLVIFLKSLRASCMDCFIVLFCRELSVSVQRILTQTNAWCIPYDFWRANSTLGPAGDHRFALYSNFLALAGSSVRNVFLSDVRDVAFQGSPFDALDLAPPDVVFFLEDKRRLIQVNAPPQKTNFCFSTCFAL
jgi:hypothetical protein